MSKIKGVDPLSIPSTSKKRTAEEVPNHSVKKPNGLYRYNIPISNQYDSLSEEEDNNSDIVRAETNNFKRVRIPPIIVYSYFDNHVSTITNLERNMNEELDLKFKGRRIIILTKNIMDYNYVKNQLDEAQIQYTTKTPSNERELKLVIRNLPPNITTDEIKDDLKRKKLPVTKVAQITKKENKTIIHAYPLFMVTFEKGTDFKTVIEHRKICYCLIQWEKIKRSGTTQCYRCQSFGHIAQNCTKTPRCVICGQAHLTTTCENKGKTPKCANCGGEHTASYSQCPKRPTPGNRPTSGNKTTPHSKPSQPIPTKNSFPPFRNSTPQVNNKVPVWPTQSGSQTDSSISGLADILSIIKSLFTNFNLQLIIKKLKDLVMKINVAPDGVSKLMIIVDFAVSMFG